MYDGEAASTYRVVVRRFPTSRESASVGVTQITTSKPCPMMSTPCSRKSRLNRRSRNSCLKSAISDGSSAAPRLDGKLTFNTPVGRSSTPRISSNASSMWPAIRCQRLLRRSPASVRLSRRVLRFNNATPSSCSNSATRRLTVDGPIRRCSAAFRKLRVSATKPNIRRFAGSIESAITRYVPSRHRSESRGRDARILLRAQLSTAGESQNE